MKAAPKKMAFVGWDIGGHGGIVVVGPYPDDDRRFTVLSQFDGEDLHRKSGRSSVPDLHKQLFLFKELRKTYALMDVAIEEQSPRPGEGVVSVKTLAACYWGARGLMQGLGQTYSVVPPRVWQGDCTWRLATVQARASELERSFPSLGNKARWVAVAERYTAGLDLAPGRAGAAPRDGLSDAACLALWTASRRRDPS